MAANPILKFFSYDHLPQGVMQDTSKALHDVAGELNRKLPDCAEKSAGLRKLLEAKDCFVRAAMSPTPQDSSRE